MSAGGSIWYIHPYAGGPGIGRYDRPFHLAREWAARGQPSVILTAANHHLLDVPRPAGCESVQGVPYEFLPTPRYRGNGLGRIANMAAFSFQLVRHADRLARDHGRPSLVVTSSPHPYAFLAGRRLARRFGARCVFEVRDLWPLSLVELAGVRASHPLVRFTGWLEREAYRTSDDVVSLLPCTREHMRAAGLDTARWHYIPNGVAAASAPGELPDSEAARQVRAWRAEGRAVVVYAGAMGRPNHVSTLVEAMAEEGPRRLASAVIVGRGELQAELRAQVEALGLQGHVRIFDQVPKAAVQRLLREASAGYISLRPEPIFRFGVSPNKLFDYMQAALPVLFAVRAGNDPVAECGCGFSIDPGDAKAIAAAITRLAQMPEAERADMGRRGEAYVARHHGYDTLATAYLQLLGKAGA
ncbi:glycosyltransferase family 4 protein [Ramlibacter pallidus]|uniref:Glycosyltransferase family 4 protein n=1 Tax=Ramlibacter pallidus TaxID=2780087 RepID=A0ABR9RYC8_9BURK|nr:glycosyltransferase family 4 protein [Ramlibacter pallidus]MBE7366261.1 glycosyltransferase family 4 protein [Ramlibacter pallidus]